VSVFPCSACGQRKPGKLASVYWAWFLADNSRSAYRQRLCIDCYVEEVNEPLVDSIQHSEACPFCHAVCGSDADPTYATIYLPKREPEEIVFATCGADAVTLRVAAQRGAQKLADREVGVRGPSTNGTSTSAWDAIGLKPEE
jgi:hypothetical protein